MRASIGPFWGYFAGVMGLVESIYFIAASLFRMGEACTITFGTPRVYEILWWAVGYVVMMFST